MRDTLTSLLNPEVGRPAGYGGVGASLPHSGLSSSSHYNESDGVPVDEDDPGNMIRIQREVVPLVMVTLKPPYRHVSDGVLPVDGDDPGNMQSA